MEIQSIRFALDASEWAIVMLTKIGQLAYK